MTDNSVFMVDIDKIVRGKAPRQYKYIPNFIISYLKHIVHQDEINKFLLEHKNACGVEFLDAALKFTDIKIEIQGKENLPENGRATFVCNHPLGGLDGISIGAILGHRYNGRIKFIVNDLLMNLHNLAPLWVPVNKTGHQSRFLPEAIDNVFNSENSLIMFPAGLCSRFINGRLQDREWGKAFITKSVETQRNIVPMYFEGRNSNFFYNLSRIRQSLGIKFNIEMLYLADEMFKNRHHTFKLVIGKPILWQTFNKQRHPFEWSAYVRDIVYKLKYSI